MPPVAAVVLGLNLKEGRARGGKGLREEAPRIVIVEELDGIRDGDLLLGAGALLLREGVFPRRAVLLQAVVQGRVFLELLARVVAVLLEVDDLHADLTKARRLRLDLLAQGDDLLLLRFHHHSELLLRRLLSGCRLFHVLLHGVLHLVQDANDLAAARAAVAVSVLLGRGEEARHQVPIGVTHVDGGREAPQDRRRGGLQEASAKTLPQGRDGQAQGLDVCLRLQGLLLEGRRLLDAEALRLRESLLGVGPVALRGSDLVREAVLLGDQLLEAALYLRHLRLRGVNGLLEVRS
mmetsp:Transcript_71442/g.209782  ORF Transcript_71442/g.209782 Transcript_71442/m.209782 type:complete len:293 (-) Transcript_71442:350-1228(-)